MLPEKGVEGGRPAFLSAADNEVNLHLLATDLHRFAQIRSKRFLRSGGLWPPKPLSRFEVEKSVFHLCLSVANSMAVMVATNRTGSSD